MGWIKRISRRMFGGNPLHEAAGATLVPQHLAAAAPVVGLPGKDGFFQSVAVHVTQHQHLAAAGIGRHAGDESVAIKLWGQIMPFLDLLDRCTWRETEGVSGSRALIGWIAHEFSP